MYQSSMGKLPEMLRNQLYIPKGKCMQLNHQHFLKHIIRDYWYVLRNVLFTDKTAEQALSSNETSWCMVQL